MVVRITLKMRALMYFSHSATATSYGINGSGSMNQMDQYQIKTNVSKIALSIDSLSTGQCMTTTYLPAVWRIVEGHLQGRRIRGFEGARAPPEHESAPSHFQKHPFKMKGKLNESPFKTISNKEGGFDVHSACVTLATIYRSALN